MKQKRLLPAPLDDKNVTTDWIEGMFDSGSALYGSHKAIGFIAGAAVQASWSGNALKWKVLDGDRYEAIKRLRERYWKRYPDNPSPFVVKEQILANVCIMRFYWKPDND